VKTELKQKWLAALRSGDYVQGVGKLRGLDNRYCCLGVLCDVLDKNSWSTAKDRYEYRGHSRVLWSGFRAELGLPDDVHMDLVTMNDEGASFAKIANCIERRVPESA
jgi:hypothetical protein